MNTNDRPTGHDQKISAMVCAGLAAMLAIFGWQMPTERYGQIIPLNIAVRFWLLVLSGGFTQLAVLLWLTGIIVHAIWFLPGRDNPPDTRTAMENPAPTAASPSQTHGVPSAPPPGLEQGDKALIFAALSLVGVIALCIFWGLASGL